jgi:hypothetical protein
MDGARAQLTPAEEREHDVGEARARRLGEDDQGLADEVVEPQRVGAVRQGMADRQCRDQRLVPQEPLLHRGIGKGDAAEADVDAPILEGRHLLDRGELEQGEVDPRSRRPEAANYLGQAAVERRGHEAEREAPATGVAQPLGHRPDLLDALEDLERLLVDEAASLGQAKRPELTLDQLDAEFLLELLDLSAERRLGDVQPLGGPGEAPLAHDRHEVAQVTEFQGDTSG